MKPVIVVIVLACAAGVLVWQGVSAKIPVLQIHQVTAEGYQGGSVQVDGGKVHEILSLSPLRFRIAPDGDAATVLTVESSEIVPENFKVGGMVSVRGEYDRRTGVFRAYRVTTSCPSKYRAAEEAISEDGGSPDGNAAAAAPQS